ncbi:hypothetical protein ASC89_16025 [Devosia sp. Root413D1]|uniref:hypothetical protein n=1 Tax=unclassified Devosia TaxID=196773 RepID=UPI0006F68E10|nr:hypothetical protein [Devosia sp. Root413D1]KQW78293.1 hypothetical protein ASC89_16025 [Devosia sp. Root413D1]
MADYKELLRRAVEALPENNGAARRAVYEKARAALVGQLRAINPPLAARDITAHRLQLEDCIRQVEQEASEAVIAGLGSGKEDNPPPPPVYFEPPAKKAPAAVAKPVAKPVPQNGKEPPRPLPPGGSIEEIIAAANAEQTEGSDRSRSIVRPDAKPMGKPVPKLVPSTQRQQPQLAAPVPSDEDEDDGEELQQRSSPVRSPIPARSPTGRSPLPSIVARAEAAKSRTGNAAFGAPIGGAARGPVLEPRRELPAPRMEPAGRNGQAAARQMSEPVALFNDPPIAAAMSAVREVEVEAPPADPQGAIDRAIATLDREARGDTEFEEPVINGGYSAFDDEADEPPARQNGFAPSILKADARPQREGKAAKASAFARDAREPRGKKQRDTEPNFPRARAEDERRGLGAVTIFLIVFAVLLIGAGGAGFWAWREGFIDLDQMFGRGAPATQQAAVTAPTPAETTTDTPATGPGNTATPAESDTPTAELGATDDRLGTETAAAPAELSRLVPAAPEERLGTDQQTAATDATQAAASVDPASLAGSQSLLLEASDSGTTGAVPFSGTVEWSKGTDEMGLPTLIGKANIPARNLAVDVLIRKNSDASLPASHLMEVNFRVTDSFIGGSIAGLPGVLLKNEELVQGTPLVGASARVVGNSFLFALSASPADITANSSLLTSRKWMDLALIYATGKRAIITLEKDAAAETMFTEVVGEWTKSVAAAN